MEQETPPQKNPQNESGSKDPPLEPSLALNREKENEHTENPTRTRDDENNFQVPRLNWGRKALEPAALGQFIAAILTIITLAWLIYSTNQQLAKTDQSLQYTKTADCVATLALVQSRVSDSINRVLYVKADSLDQLFSIKDTQARARNTMIQLRPYINIVRARIETHPDFWIVEFVIHNSGATPAFNVDWKIKYHFTSMVPNESKFWNADTSSIIFKHAFIGPGDSLKTTIPMRGVDIWYSNGKNNLYTINIINYNDAWGYNHGFKVCHFYIPGKPYLGIYHKYNEAN
jgi:hypothetical protein